ncbi:coronin-7-like [Corticium candelabrum]|uniref:coronin-7-like n=1 Tax=Corticium candelabrum TaxID=121492 RepID=UPI002E26A9E2|nr:coronin-7-like [Corticium candelabrum]
MAGRFRTSKYRNAVAVAPRENILSDIKVASPNCYSNLVATSCKFKAFPWNSSGGCLGVFPLFQFGRLESEVRLLQAHSGIITDFQFSPFDDCLLATGSEDLSVRLWRIPPEGLTENLSTPETSLKGHEKRVEGVLFHPTANDVLTSSSGNTVRVWDIQSSTEKLLLSPHQDVVQSMSWRGDGTTLATASKDKKIRLLDPRADCCVAEADGHLGVKESKVLFLGDTNYVITTGFSKSRERQFALWDVREFSKPLTCPGLDSSTGPLIPLYDEDTRMLFLAGKAESNIRYLDLTDLEKSPHYVEASVFRVSEQTKGVALQPKRSLAVMGCEVVRILQLAQHSLYSVSYHVKRKSYREFHEDLYPDTLSGEPALSSEAWFSGDNKEVGRVSLDPSKQPSPAPAVAHADTKKSRVDKETVTSAAKSVSRESTPTEAANQMEDTEKEQSPVEVLGRVPVIRSVAGVRTSRFRHTNSKVLHPRNHIEGITAVGVSIPSDCNVFHSNDVRAAFPLTGPGGQIAVVELKETGRLPLSIPFLQNTATVMDFCIDPFDRNVVTIAGDDGKVKVFRVPDGGLTDIVKTPEIVLQGHYEKVNIIQYHPLAQNVLATAGFDMALIIWDVATGAEKIRLEGHEEQIFAMAWSPDGQRLVTYSRDKKLRLFEPRSQTKPLQEGIGPDGSRGGRLVFVTNTILLVSGSDKQSCRQLSLYNTEDLAAGPITVKNIDVAPSLLIPHFDPDTNVVFLSAKGDCNIRAFEVCVNEAPYFLDINSFTTTMPQQGVVFLPKHMCNVREVEYARALRLTKAVIEPVEFKVPRSRPQYFQDDIFPDTTVYCQPALSSSEWFAGKNGECRQVCLKPDGMKPLSEAPKEAPAAKKYGIPADEPRFKTDQEKKEELMSAMVGRMAESEDPLPQDEMEGVDEDEWDD